MQASQVQTETLDRQVTPSLQDIPGADYRNAMARLGAAVTIATTDGPGGRAGFAATAVCSLSDTPPTLLVCLNKGSSAHPAVRANKVLCINVASHEHQELCGLFGGKTPVEQRFAAATWRTLETGAPVLQGALVSFDCRIVTIHDGGTHDILICEVVKMAGEEAGRPLIYFARAYHRL
ncbi:MAG: flavin reductase [Shinella sp.]|nr:flavin reductase [Shinella sp.]